MNISNLAWAGICLLSCASAFSPVPVNRAAPSTSALNMAEDVDFTTKVEKLFGTADKSTQYDVMIKLTFPGALNYEQLERRLGNVLGERGYTPENTLLATSLCCDELARDLEKNLVAVYGNNFNLGGLAGFPFAGKTGFGAST